MTDLYILGAGGHAREIAGLVADINRERARFRLVGLVGASRADVGSMAGRHRIVVADEDLETLHGAAVIAIGQPAVVRTLAGRLEAAPGLSCPALVHPSVRWEPDTTTLGDGAIVCAGSILSCDIEVGPFALVNRAVNVGHDARVGAWTVINPGAIISGGVRIGQGCLIGAGAIIIQNLNVADGAMVGAGAVVTRDVPAGATVVGVPARAR